MCNEAFPEMIKGGMDGGQGHIIEQDKKVFSTVPSRDVY